MFELLGDYHEDEYNYEPAPGMIEGWSDVVNTGEEAMAYAFIELTHNGYNTPVQTTSAELDRLTKEQAPFIVLPPIPEGTPPGGHVPSTCLGTNSSASLGTDRASLYSGSKQLSWPFVIAIFIVVLSIIL